MAEKNARKAGVDGYIHFQEEDFFESSGEKGEGLLVINPPYGERLEQEDITGFYREIGSRLKHFYEGFNAWVISGNLQALKYIGLKTSKKVPLFNGPKECKLHKYELYKGSRK